MQLAFGWQQVKLFGQVKASFAELQQGKTYQIHLSALKVPKIRSDLSIEHCLSNMFREDSFLVHFNFNRILNKSIPMSHEHLIVNQIPI